MTESFWWSVLWVAFLLEALLLVWLALWWLSLRSDAAMLRRSTSSCPVCQVERADVLDFDEEDVGDYCRYHFASWTYERERARRGAWIKDSSDLYGPPS